MVVSNKSWQKGKDDKIANLPFFPCRQVISFKNSEIEMQDLNATKTLNKVQAGAFSIRPSEFSQLNLTLLHKWKYAGGGKCNFCKLMKMRLRGECYMAQAYTYQSNRAFIMTFWCSERQSNADTIHRHLAKGLSLRYLSTFTIYTKRKMTASWLDGRETGEICPSDQRPLHKETGWRLPLQKKMS